MRSETGQMVLDVRDLPAIGFDHRAPLWWGNTLLLFIETTMFGSNLQQLRWPPSNIANSPQEALSRLVLLSGAHYKDPEFSWKYAVAPGGIGFVKGRALGPQYDGDL